MSSKYRFFEDGKFYYFSVPYMSIEMFHKLQEPKSDSRIFEQYTGMKDKNGKEHWSDSIFKMSKTGHVYSTVYKNGAFGYISWGGDFMTLDNLIKYCLTYEIIGNIHEEKSC